MSAYQLDPACPTCKGTGTHGRSTTGEDGECTGEWEEACTDCESALVLIRRGSDVAALDDWARKQGRCYGHETMQIAGGLVLVRLLDPFSITKGEYEESSEGAARSVAAQAIESGEVQ